MVISDNGDQFFFARATLQKKYKERLPFFSIILPDWFKERFPNSYRVLQMNAANTLTSSFNIRETFKTVHYQINEGIDVGSLELFLAKKLLVRLGNDNGSRESVISG